MNAHFSRFAPPIALMVFVVIGAGCATSPEPKKDPQSEASHKEKNDDKVEKVAAKKDSAGQPEASEEVHAGVKFTSGGLDNALSLAQKKNQNILVEVWASWCSPCRAQKAEVFEKGAGLALTRNLVSWQMDFDVEGNRTLVEKWHILNLPTVLFLRPDGTEIGRIEGYEDKEQFLAEAEKLALGEDELPKWQARLAGEEKKPLAERTKAMVEVGHRLLVRGDEKGRKLLEEVVAGDVKYEWEGAQQALFLLGRYHSRVKHDYKTGEGVWRALHDHYPVGEYATTAAWWTAGAMLEQGQAEQAVTFLIDRTHGKPNADDIDLVVSFAAKSKMGVRKAQALLSSVDDNVVPQSQREEWEKILAAIDGGTRVE